MPSQKCILKETERPIRGFEKTGSQKGRGVGGTYYCAGVMSFPHLSQKVAYPGIWALQFGQAFSLKPLDLMYWCIILVSSV